MAQGELKTGGVHHLAVVVRDLARAEAFYGGVLGLPVERRHDDAAGRPRAVWLALAPGANASFLALERSDAAGAGAAPRADAAPGWHCVALAIARGEREAWRARLAAAGHPVERESSYTLYVRDPDGALVALSHWPDAA
jgi:glyoxylase I family protein